MKFLSCLLPLLIFLPIHTIPLELFSISQDEQNPSIQAQPSKTYKVNFFSLKRGHTISSSYFTFKDGEKFEMDIPGERFLKTKGDYTKNNLQFKAVFQGTLIKQKKHYTYEFNISGFSLLDRYIAGMLVLNESIQETRQDQEVTFLFIGTPEEDGSSDNEKRSLFPF